MASPPYLSQFPTLEHQVVKKLATSSTCKITAPKFDKLMDARLKARGKTTTRGLAAADEREVRQISKGLMSLSQLAPLQASKGCRRLNDANVRVIANLLAENGYDKDFPLKVGLIPVDDDNPSGRKVRTCMWHLTYSCFFLGN